MIKEFLGKKVNRIILGIIGLLIIILAIIVVAVVEKQKKSLNIGQEYVLVETFGKKTGFPGQVYTSNGELRILIDNDSNTNFVVEEYIDNMIIVEDNYKDENGKSYQQFRVSYHDYSQKLQMDAYNIEAEEGKAFVPVEEVETIDNTEGGKGFSTQFTLVNKPKKMAYEIKVEIDNTGNIYLSSVSENTKYMPKDLEDIEKTVTDKYGEIGGDKISIVYSDEGSINDDSENSVSGDWVMTFYDENYVEIFLTESANEQKLLDYYSEDYSCRTETIDGLSVNIFSDEVWVIGVFTKDNITVVVNSFREEKELTKYIENLY